MLQWSPIKHQLAAGGFVLREMTAQDLEPVWRWRNRDDIRASMFQSQPIPYERHCQWFESIQGRADQQHFVIHYREEPIGVINIRVVGEGTLVGAPLIEPGMYIAHPRLRGTALALAPALIMNDYCFEDLASATLRARVRPENEAAIRFNRALGYREYARDSDQVEMWLQWEDHHRASAPLRRLLR